MKKIVFIYIFALSIFSCTTEQNGSAVPEGNLSKIESVLKMDSDEDSQKVAYRLLNDSEKFDFWKNKFDLILEEGQLNDKQKFLVQELQNRLNLSIFSEVKNDEKEYFKNIFIPSYLERVKVEFTFNEIYVIFYSARVNYLTVAPIGGGEEGGGSGGFAKDCNCNQGSLFGCGASQNCRNSDTCKIKPKDCGFLFFYDCDGLCNLYS